MLYCIRMDVRVPHALAPEQLERLKAEEKARAGTAARRQVAAPVACCGAIHSIFDVADHDELHALCR
jgi:muconolactone D-isomerase